MARFCSCTASITAGYAIANGSAAASRESVFFILNSLEKLMGGKQTVRVNPFQE